VLRAGTRSLSRKPQQFPRRRWVGLRAAVALRERVEELGRRPGEPVWREAAREWELARWRQVMELELALEWDRREWLRFRRVAREGLERESRWKARVARGRRFWLCGGCGRFSACGCGGAAWPVARWLRRRLVPRCPGWSGLRSCMDVRWRFHRGWWFRTGRLLEKNLRFGKTRVGSSWSSVDFEEQSAISFDSGFRRRDACGGVSQHGCVAEMRGIKRIAGELSTEKRGIFFGGGLRGRLSGDQSARGLARGRRRDMVETVTAAGREGTRIFRAWRSSRRASIRLRQAEPSWSGVLGRVTWLCLGWRRRSSQRRWLPGRRGSSF
jgi:hypothetical protein